MNRKIKRKPFTTISLDVFGHPNLKPSDIAVLAALGKYADNNTRKCWPTMKTLENDLNMTRQTISKSINRLEENGFIKVSHKHLGKKTQYIYTILDTEEADEKEFTEITEISDVKNFNIDNRTNVKNFNINYTKQNKNYTNKKTLSKDKGETSFASQKTLIDIPKPLASKPKKKKPMTHREIGLAKIKDAKNGLISWENVTYRDFTYYYIEKHNEKMKKKISFNRYESVSIIRDSFINSFNIPKERVCEYIDKLLDIYSDSPLAWDCLSFNMIRNNHPLMKDLMLRVETALNEPKKEKLTQEELEKQLQYHREIQAKIEAGTAVLGVDYF